MSWTPGDDRPAMSRQDFDELFREVAGTAGVVGHGPGQPGHAASPPPSQGGLARRPPDDLHHVTSDLSIDETLLLHSLDWEPVDMVVGASVAAIPTMGFGAGGWSGATDQASSAFTAAVASATARVEADCRRAGGVGVIGVEVDFQVHRHVVQAVLVGTAVRPARGAHPGPVFVSDLSTRDFVLLHNAGWIPLGLAFGASFVQVPYRSLGTVFKQMAANTEMTNLTEALYGARAAGMERLQVAALGMGASGVVAVQYSDRPLPFASHVIGFTAWGTAVRLRGDHHQHVAPQVVVSLDDRVDAFDLQGAMRTRR